jgi:hypothetical protein
LMTRPRQGRSAIALTSPTREVSETSILERFAVDLGGDDPSRSSEPHLELKILSEGKEGSDRDASDWHGLSLLLYSFTRSSETLSIEISAHDQFKPARARWFAPTDFSTGSKSMKRSGVLLAPAFLAFAVAGCDSGLKEGAATGDLSPQTAQFKEEQQKNAAKMKMKKPGGAKNAPAPATTPTPTPEKKDAP